LAKFIRATGNPVTKSETIHFSGRFLGLKERDSWEYAFRTNASGVVVLVPITDAGELVLVEQYRTPVESRVLELPAGLVGDTGNPHEDFETAARRELIEETGYHAASLEELLTSPSTPGMSDEMITIFYASGLERVGPGGGDSNEDITVHLVPLKDAPRWLEAHRTEGIMLDPKIFAGLYWAGMRESTQSE
jgi:ADP-ribose pyrophosphatase